MQLKKFFWLLIPIAGFSDLTRTHYSEVAIDLARSLVDPDGFTSIKFLVDYTKLDRKFPFVIDKQIKAH
ncbi:hypothetical protein ACH5RR_032838 [Cinchona calisaya]|uniref:Uncharacterized protein n=1 Tax=Cinchona calisaya TaxID=153742 RepID=A0ABD2YJA9_9GENT